MKLIKTVASAAFGAAMLFGTAHATTFSFDITQAFFSDPDPAANGTLLDTDATPGADRVEFGAGMSPGAIGFEDSTPVAGNVGDTFSLGAFIHENFPITAGTEIDGAILNIVGDLTLDGTLFSGLTFAYDVDINNTPNVATDCPGDSVPCDDIITITSLTDSATVLFNGDFLTLKIIGFFLDGVQTDTFATVEGEANRALLLAEISAVPLPGALPLMAAGMGIFAAMRRRRPQAA